MSGDANVNRPLPSLILLGIVDFCCILIGLEQISVHKIAGGAIWIVVGVGSGLIGYHWLEVKRAIASVGTWFKKKPSKLVIHWANYRAVESGGDVCEVGDFLRQIIAGDSLVFDIENHNFVIGDKNFVPHDPLPFKEKRLQVNYSYGGEIPVITERREHGRLLLPEDSKIKWLMAEVARLTAAQPAQLGLSSLQIEAIHLASELLNFLKQIGSPPAPKYTAAEIDKMTSAQMKALINANDGDFLEAVEYYRPGEVAFTREGLENQLTSQWARLLPWYQKLEAAYALKGFKGKVETLRNRFLLEGIMDNVLLMPIEGKYGAERIRNIAAKLWELAYKIGEKETHEHVRTTTVRSPEV